MNKEVKAMMITALLTSLLMLVCAAPRAEVTAEVTQKDFKERDELNQTYQLGPGTRVEVSSIRGTVEISNSDSTTAEVQIIRTARTPADLEHHKIEVEQTSNSLVVRGVQEPQGRGDKIQVNHKVILKLPRRVDLSVSSISGWIKVGDIDGQTHVSSISGSANIGNVGRTLQVQSISGSLEVGNVGADADVSSISGNVRLGQVNNSLEVSSVSGGVNVTLTSLDPQGIRIRSISGSVEIGFKSDVNADFSAEHISGQVYLEMPNVTRDSDDKSSNVRARIGAGGTPITISSVSGNIRLTKS
jgi:Putative adhesin